MPIFKKIFFFSLFILSLISLLFGVYKISFQGNPPSTSKKESPAISTNILPKISPKPLSVTLVSSEKILAPIFLPEKNAIRCFGKTSEEIIEINIDGVVQRKLSSEKISGVVNALWSADKNKVILKRKSENNVFDFTFYDLENNNLGKLKNNVDEVSWQNNANRIFYKYYDPKTKERTLNISDPDGANWKKLADIPYQKISIAQIPKIGTVSFWNRGESFEKTLFQSIPLIGGEITKIFDQGFGADYLWSPSGNKILVSQTNAKGGNKSQLGVMNYRGGEFKNLEAPTFVSKCVWSSDEKTIFCALPGNIPDYSILPDDYKNGKFLTADTFWKINLENGEKKRLLEVTDIDKNYDASQLFLNQDESLLFFINKADDNLYKINI